MTNSSNLCAVLFHSHVNVAIHPLVVVDVVAWRRSLASVTPF